MQPNNLAVHGQTPKTAVAHLSTASAADGSGASLLYEAGPNGAVCIGVSATPAADITKTKLILYVQPAGSPIKARKESVVLNGYVQATDTADPVAYFTPTEEQRLLLGAGDKLFVASRVTGEIDVVAQFVNF